MIVTSVILNIKGARELLVVVWLSW